MNSREGNREVKKFLYTGFEKVFVAWLKGEDEELANIREFEKALAVLPEPIALEELDSESKKYNSSKFDLAFQYWYTHFVDTNHSTVRVYSTLAFFLLD